MTASMSRKADCFDNAPTESFFHTLKTELVHHRRYAMRQQARRDVFAFIESLYNRTRLHSEAWIFRWNSDSPLASRLLRAHTGVMKNEDNSQRLRVEVKHRGVAPERYTWELHAEYVVLPVKESIGGFNSWDEASQAGQFALKKYIQD
jgi:Integrase core domain